MRSAVIAMVLLIGAPVRAFHGQADFDKPALEGGGDGMYYTGSPRFRRWDCTLCHTDAPGEMFLTLASDPPELVRDARWAPSTTYRVTVSMQNEHRGRGAALNPNTFVLEMLDGEARAAGLFVGLGPEVERPPGQELVIARGEIDGVTEWTFDWEAPAPGTGPVSLYLAGVDGDGAGDRLGRTGDPFGDDVFAGSLELEEEGTLQTESKIGGCSAAGGGESGGILFTVGAIALLALRRRRLRWGLALLVGCHDPSLDLDECTRGICETPGDGGRTDEAGTTGPDDARDGGGLVRVDSGIDAGPPPDGCVPAWACTAWAVVCGGEATRTCVDDNGCGSDWARPPETRPLATLDESFYRCRVQPIFDRSCSQLACHGTEDRPLRTYSRVKWRMNPLWRGTHNSGGNAALTAEEWCRNFSSARLFAEGDAASSQLLTQPLSPTLGGLAHAGYTLFYDTSDPDYQTIRQWLEGASLPSCDAGFND